MARELVIIVGRQKQAEPLQLLGIAFLSFFSMIRENHEYTPRCLLFVLPLVWNKLAALLSCRRETPFCICKPRNNHSSPHPLFICAVLSFGLSIVIVCSQHFGHPLARHLAELTDFLRPQETHQQKPRLNCGTSSTMFVYILIPSLPLCINT
jgi:hypothetical protein